MDPRPVVPGWRSLARNLAAGVLGLAAAAAAFLASGGLLVLFVGLTPYHGNDAALLIVLKSVAILGWLAIGLWLLADWWHLRLRVLIPPVAAWIWTYLLAETSSGIGYLNWGP